MKSLTRALICVMFISIVCAPAGAEEEGLIKRMFRKFEERGKEEPAPVAEPRELPVDIPEDIPVNIVEIDGDNVTVEPEKNPFSDLTKEDMIDRICGLLDYHPEVLNFVPTIHAVTNEDGSVTYLYKSESGIGVDLEDLDRETLQNLVTRVSSESNRINTEKIMKQLEQARQAQRAAAPIPQPPRVHTPPRIPDLPRQPVTPPAANRTPQPPPQPPRN